MGDIDRILLNKLRKDRLSIFADKLNIPENDIKLYIDGGRNPELETAFNSYIESKIFEKMESSSYDVFHYLIFTISLPGIYNIIVPEDSGHNFFISKVTQTLPNIALTTIPMDFKNKDKVIIDKTNYYSTFDIERIKELSAKKPVFVISYEELGLTEEYYYVPGLTFNDCFDTLTMFSSDLDKISEDMRNRIAWSAEQRFSLLVRALKVLTIELETDKRIDDSILDLI